MKKSLISVFLTVLLMILALTACGKINNGNIDDIDELPFDVEVTGLEGITGTVEAKLLTEAEQATALAAVKEAYYVADGAEIYSLDISIMNDGEKVKVGKPVTVSIALKTHDLPFDKYVVFHVHDGKADKIVPRVDGSKLVITVDSFSPFIITPEHEHTYGEWVFIDGEPACGESVMQKRTCVCGDEQMRDYTGDHIDKNNDGNCDKCGVSLGGGTNPDSEATPGDGTGSDDGTESGTGTKPGDETGGETPSSDVYTRDGSVIYFGSYPQTRVTDTALIGELKALAGTAPTTSNSYNWTAYSYNRRKGSTVSAYMWYIDLNRGNERYRGVYLKDYRPIMPSQNGTAGDPNRQQDNGIGINTMYFYRYEPIKWRILSEENGEALLLSELIIDSQEYYPSTSYGTNIVHNGGTGAATDYALSDIRIWLNDTFYETAFSELQREYIQKSYVINNARSTNPAYNATEFNDGNNNCAGHSTNDYVFFLSVEELTDTAYGFAARLSGDTVRVKNHTDYAVSQGLGIKPGTTEGEQEGDYRLGNNWWTRSPRDDSLGNYVIDREGRIANEDNDNTSIGVVPALRICLLSKKPEVLEGDAYTRVNAIGNADNNGDYVYFGMYPQSRVTATATITALNNAAGELPTVDNWYNWDSYDYYFNGRQQNLMFFIDVELNNELYRGVYYTSYRPYFIKGTSGTDPGNYQQSKGYTRNNIYWFRYEPIKWRILKEADGKALILAELALDCQEFYSADSTFKKMHNGGEGYVNEYELSNIRKWLNDTFYNTAFGALEKSVIEMTVVDGSNDNLFLLSESEVTDASYGLSSEGARRKGMTAYAQVQGGRVETGYAYAWWLRTADGSENNKSKCVSNTGDIVSHEVNWTAYGVVPALWIDLGK